MYQHKDNAAQFDVVDIDPYGTASPFLDGSVQAVKVRTTVHSFYDSCFESHHLISFCKRTAVCLL